MYLCKGILTLLKKKLINNTPTEHWSWRLGQMLTLHSEVFLTFCGYPEEPPPSVLSFKSPVMGVGCLFDDFCQAQDDLNQFYEVQLTCVKKRTDFKCV